jgi:hypothetical protein
MGIACIMNIGEGDRILVIGEKARKKELTRKTKTCGWIILICMFEG